MFNKGEICTGLLMYEDLAAMLTIINAIPDGIHLANFPNHCDGTECWCRPQVVFQVDKIVVSHKDLIKGEFDC